MNKKSTQKKAPYNKAMRLSGAGLQMLATILLFNWLGKWLDLKYSKDFFEIGFTLFGIFMSMYLLIRQVNKLNE